jgi:hypothetical protein
MPHFVVEQNTLGLLVQDTIGGQPNPFKVAIEFLDKTEGRWDRDEAQVPWSQWNSLPNGEHRKVEGGYTIFLVPNNKMPVSGGVLTLLHTNGFTLYTHQNLPPIWQEPVEDEPLPEPA